jgi:hypothetical protein
VRSALATQFQAVRGSMCIRCNDAVFGRFPDDRRQFVPALDLPV